MEVVLEKKDASDWAYRGEGAVNLVLPYTGSSPSFIGKVVRVQKADRKELDRTEKNRTALALTLHERLLWKDTEDLVSSPNKELYPRRRTLHMRRDEEFISEGNAIKRTVPHYTMHQALKFHEGEMSAYSDYGPLDLCSGSKDRIHKAIKDLFSSTQNNFRVFLDGSLIFGALGASADGTKFVIEEAFEDALKGVISGDQGLHTKGFLQLLAETIYISGVMDRLLKVQKLDDIDIEGPIHAYYNIIAEPCSICRELKEEKVAHRYSSLYSISLDESLKIVKNFLVAATAKDCSLMMSFRPRKGGLSGSSNNSVYLEFTNQTFDYKVCFIDLDLKPLGKIEEYYEKDKKIVSCYTRMVEAKQEADKVTSLEVNGNAL